MSFKLICTGDLMLGENVHHFRRGIFSRYKGKYPSLIADVVKKQLSAADLMLVNFEASLAEDKDLAKMDINRAIYVAPLQSLSLLKSIETQMIVNIANNHFGQHGLQSANSSIQMLESNGFLVTGKNHIPVEISKEGYLLKVYGVSLVNDKYYEGAYFKSTYDSLITDLQLANKSENEIWVLSIHWGDEYLTRENKKQQILAHELAKAGFDYISGHHPHVIQPYSRIGETSVFYSHGNFIFDQNFSSLTQKGLISIINLPEGQTQLFICQQKHFKLVDIKPISTDELKRFTEKSFHRKLPFIMRIRMKLELIFRFYELNFPILRTFTGRLINN
ncbi:MAG: CapA family protein [Lentimicrobium sp.]|nr:CapA family protein [Lentimicrobium sp.]